MWTRTIEAEREIEHPANLTELRSLLGLYSVFLQFVQTFASVAAPRNMSLSIFQTQNFDGLFDKEVTALKTVIEKLLEPSVLALPRSQRDYTEYIDTCDSQIGCVLLYMQTDGPDRPIGFWSVR